MNANELRLGNFVFSDGNIVEIERIERDYIETTANFEGITNGEIEPIPLTEEWHIKFGAHKLSEIRFMYPFRSVEFIFNWDKTKQEWWVEFKNHNIQAMPILIKYVHELQNIYFALTGEELELKAIKRKFV